MKVNVSTPILNVRELSGVLSLKDGQHIIGQILRNFEGQVLLQLAGKTVDAHLEGETLPEGAVVLFQVALADPGRIELRVMDMLSPETRLGQKASLPANLDDQALIKWVETALGEVGMRGDTVQIRTIIDSLRTYQGKYQQWLEPKIFAFLLRNQLPITSGTVLFSWLYQDRDLRALLWNLLAESSRTRGDSSFLPKVWDPGTLGGTAPTQEQDLQGQNYGNTEKMQPKALDDFAVQKLEAHLVKALREEITPVTTDKPYQSSSTGRQEYTKEELDKICSLLEKSLNFERAVADAQSGVMETYVPILLKDSDQTVREYIVKWKEKQDASGSAKGNVESVRVVIPTENMGEIVLQMMLNDNNIRIGFKVNSEPIRRYFLQNIAELQTLLRVPTQITVAMNETRASQESRFDLWM